MPTYPVIHKETKEKKELSMTMKAYDEWRKENPEWDKDWSAGVAGVGEVGEFQDKIKRSHPGWNDVLHKVSKMPGSTVRPIK
tara:strand:+ start:190 stop:435 length:246 start_codon:yes stop_codon:yes gene_type:complete